MPAEMQAMFASGFNQNWKVSTAFTESTEAYMEVHDKRIPNQRSETGGRLDR